MNKLTGISAVLAASVLGLGLSIISAGPASAHEFKTRCDRDGDRCWRVICDNDGDDCHPTGESWGEDRPHRIRVCDGDGDDCHWVYRERDDDHYRRDHAFLGIHLGN